jgi:hypothetical protein
VSEWLDLMLEEIRRKEREAREAEDETRRRAASADESGKVAQELGRQP